MVLRRNKTDRTRFWGCVNYPDCRGTEDLDYDDVPFGGKWNDYD